jgi:hypothetical protein
MVAKTDAKFLLFQPIDRNKNSNKSVLTFHDGA